MTQSAQPQTAVFLGTRFHLLTRKQAGDEILAQADGPFRYVVTPNVHHMVRLLDEATGMRPLYARAWRVLCDSRVLSRLARLDGLSLPVVTGSDLTADLLDTASARGMTIAVVGPAQGDCERLQARYPGLKILAHTPPQGFIGSEPQTQAAIDFVVTSAAPLTFLAVGMPQQEQLARRIADHPQARGIALCIGASIDFLTGKQARAPLWLQRAGLEWSYRLMSNPARFASRYLVECPKIFYFMYQERSGRLPAP